MKSESRDLLKLNSRIDKSAGPNSCWLWGGAANNSGYGLGRFFGKVMLAHRASWMLNNGEIPKGMYVLHKCDTPLCCNPLHLSIGTQAENMRDKCLKGRFRKTISGDFRCGEGHYRSKLKNCDVLKIRELFATGNFLQKQIAIDFAISETVVSQILHRKTWKHL